MMDNHQLRCTWCDGFHDNSRCPRVKAFEYGEDGSVSRVEFWSPSEKIKVEIVLGLEKRIEGLIDELNKELEE